MAANETLENILVSLRLDLPTTAETIRGLKEEVSGLKEATDKLNAGTADATKAAAANTEATERQQKSIKATEEAMKAEEGSISRLRARNKELRAERDNLSTSTDKGRERIQQINKELDKNNSTIKENVDAYTKQKMTVGDYTGALDKLVPGLGSTIEGFKGMTKAAISFTATPLGLIIAAIALALGSLIAYFKGSEEGQNKLNKIMMYGTVVFESLMNVVEALGEYLFNGLSKAFDFIGGIIGKVTTAIGINTAETNAYFKQMEENANKMAKLDADIDKKERDLIEGRSATRLEVARLRQEADEAEGQRKRDLIAEAIALELSLGEEEVRQLQMKQERAAERVRLFGDDKEALKELAEANAALNDAEAEALENTRRLNKERLALDRELLKEQELQRDVARAKEHLANQTNHLEGVGNLKAAKDMEVKIFTDASESMLRAAQHLNEEIQKGTLESTENAIENFQRRAQAFLAEHEAEIQMVMATLDVASDISSKITEVKNMQYKNDMDDLTIHLQEQRASLKADFDNGLIDEEAYKGALLELDKDNRKKQDEIKRKAFEVNKKNQIIQTEIDAVQSSLGAFRALVGIPVVGPVLAAAAAAAALVFGYAKVQEIKGSQYVPGYAIGGKVVSGTRISRAMGTPIRRSNGDNVLITAKENEVILNENQQAALGGAAMFRRLGVPGFGGTPVGLPGGYALGGVADDSLIASLALRNSDATDIISAINNIPRQVLVLQEFESVQESRNNVQTKADLL